MYGFEVSRAFLKRPAALFVEEWDKPYPTVRGFINARMNIALVRATNRCIRGFRILAIHKCRIDFVGKEVQNLSFKRVIIS